MRKSTVTYHDTTKTKYTYDIVGRVLSASEWAAGATAAAHTITSAYDGLDRLTTVTTPETSVGYSYDANNRRTGMTVTGQTAQTYAYDNASRLLSITQGTKVTSFSYDAASRTTGMTLANGLTSVYAYDIASQLSSITYKNGASVVGDIGYTYDAGGRRLTQTGTLHEAFLPAATTTAPAYDANNKLTSWNGVTYVYDNNGSLTSDGTKTYTWDVRNRLKQINQGATVLATFTYDALNRRIAKTIGTTTTKYGYDGANAVQELTSTNAVSANITAGFGMDNWLYRTEGAASRYFLTDALNSTRALSDDSKAITTRYQYEPYGETTSSGAASTNTSQYTGRENDGTGLYYYRARYYSPVTKRFISEDPIGLAGGINTYAYVGGNPLLYTDPSGKNAITGAVLGSSFGPLGTVIGAGIGLVGGYLAADQLSNWLNKPAESSGLPRGFIDAVPGSEQWGRNNGVDPSDARGRFHGIKQDDQGQGGGKGRDKYGVNPNTGDVCNPAGETVGNLGQSSRK